MLLQVQSAQGCFRINPPHHCLLRGTIMPGTMEAVDEDIILCGPDAYRAVVGLDVTFSSGPPRGEGLAAAHSPQQEQPSPQQQPCRRSGTSWGSGCVTVAPDFVPDFHDKALMVTAGHVVSPSGRDNVEVETMKVYTQTGAFTLKFFGEHRIASLVIHPQFVDERSTKTDVACVLFDRAELPAGFDSFMPLNQSDAAVTGDITWICLGFPDIQGPELVLHSTTGLNTTLAERAGVREDVLDDLWGRAGLWRQVTAPIRLGVNVLLAMAAACPTGASGGALVNISTWVAEGVLAKSGGTYPHVLILTEAERQRLGLPAQPAAGAPAQGPTMITAARRINPRMLRRVLGQLA